MLGSILVFLLVLSVLVIVHELGHFLVARYMGVMVEEFGFGLPPRLLGVNIQGTTYSINLFPFGGFVRLHGEDPNEKPKYPKKSFLGKSKKVRFAIVIAGVVMNFLLAVLAFAAVSFFSGIPRETKNVSVVNVVTGSPAQIAGLLVGDVVRSVNKIKVISNKEFIDLIDQTKGKRTALEIERNVDGTKTTKKFTLTPRISPPANEGPLGVVITSTEIYFPPVLLRPFYGIYYGFKEAIFWGKNVILGFAAVFSDLFKGRMPKDIAGPVGIYAIASEAAKVGIFALINFLGILSVNLAILNILPFPALDGGRLLFISIEKIIGKKVLPKVEAAVHAVGMIILLILLLAITAHDIMTFVIK